MENAVNTENTTLTLTLYRQLFNHLDLSAFNPSELLDRRPLCRTGGRSVPRADAVRPFTAKAPTVGH